jgi:hypothetical protein
MTSQINHLEKLTLSLSVVKSESALLEQELLGDKKGLSLKFFLRFMGLFI